MVNWKVGDANLRLMAAILAVHSIKVDLNAVALAYGHGATSRAIGHQISHVRELSKVLNQEVQNSGVTKAPRGSEQDASSAPQTPRAKATRFGGTRASGTGKGKRKRDAIDDTTERLINPIRGSRVNTEQDGEIPDMAEVQEETPSKRARKPARHLGMVANKGSGAEDDGGLGNPSADLGYAADDSSFVDYEGNAGEFVLPESY
ncbi:hypothetical protein UA08_00963 [Talaromyces atroroseus]|uniref:Uncharacterized protein n=1 Tax=Talaromyces atroroseus TaxID=1441469 RepID=A0A225AQ74_TALAT|nr:hypothetical protein UA08_00963 [Talaromyces atroroseus]OKL63782.1 hypothetical protein UA08_00963 [Talaromyces atroroseus]